jgi:hypothetical protein
MITKEERQQLRDTVILSVADSISESFSGKKKSSDERRREYGEKPRSNELLIAAIADFFNLSADTVIDALSILIDKLCEPSKAAKLKESLVADLSAIPFIMCDSEGVLDEDTLYFVAEDYYKEFGKYIDESEMY